MDELSADVRNLAPAEEHTDPVAEAASKVAGARVSYSGDQRVVTVDSADWPELARRLKEAGFEMLVDLCGVDYLAYPQGAARRGDAVRFEVVVNLLSISRRVRCRVRIPLIGTEPVCPSVTGVWPGANWYEREAFDLFGIEFSGHPDLSRILMPEDWEGYPLRKDYPAGTVPVQFKESPRPGMPTEARIPPDPKRQAE